MVRIVTDERIVLTGSLHTVPDIHWLFNLHKCDWMARDPGTYSEEIMREFYASYAATLRGSISRQSNPLAQDPLTSTMVRGCPRNAEQRETVILWLAKYIAADDECAEWIATPRMGIQKATLNFAAKFFWLLWDRRGGAAPTDTIGASSSAPVVEVPPVVRDIVSTTDGAMMDDVGTTEGDPTIVLAGSGKPDTPARSRFFDAMRHRFASPNPLSVTVFVCIGDNHIYALLGVG
uniref:Integrase core domain containing protein n=1 Tax=Solanum tuberosum TaxID=4113 RepID=M1DV76_SOLTU